MPVPGLIMPPGLIVPSRSAEPVELRGEAQNTGATTIQLPSGIEAGDLIVVMASRYRSSSDSAAIPTIAGYNLLAYAHSEGGSNARSVRISYKLAAGNEGGSTITVHSSTTSTVHAVVWVFRGPFSGATPGGTFELIDEGQGTHHTSVPSGGQSAPVLVLYIARVHNTPPSHFASMTPHDVHKRMGTDSHAGSISLFYKIFNDAPTNVSCSATLPSNSAYPVRCGGFLKLLR